MMGPFKSKEEAIEYASDKARRGRLGSCYGWGDGDWVNRISPGWRVGTREELARLRNARDIHCLGAASESVGRAHVRESSAGADNSWGRGYYPLPARLAGLGRFMDSLAPTKLLDHKVWPDDPTEGGDIHMLTVKDRGVNIFVRDIESLIKNGLIRIQSNEPGQVSFYFVDKPVGFFTRETPVRRHR
jgi:hypothetical protein